MCLSQKHARKRQCIVNTFFVYIFSRAFLLQLFSFSSSKFTLILLFCYLPARIISPSSTCPDLIKSVQDFCITTQLAISKSSIIWGKKGVPVVFFWSQYLLPQRWSQFLKSLSKFQKMQRGRAGVGGCWVWSRCRLQKKVSEVQQQRGSI